MITLDEILQKLRAIQHDYIPTRRTGPTGIGKTLEDVLGIAENNVDISNTTFAEIKSARKHAKSMLTLFTKAPLPASANARLLAEYGYITLESAGKKVLHTTAWATGYNTLRGEIGFRVQVFTDKVSLTSANNDEIGYWDESTLRKSFEKKLHHLLYIRADCIGRGINEKFCFNEALLLTGFNFAGFMSAISEGIICVDTRIGQFPDGSPHDHGTGFRVFPDQLSRCFTKQERLL